MSKSPERLLGSFCGRLTQNQSLSNARGMRDAMLGYFLSLSPQKTRWSAELGEANPATTLRRVTEWCNNDSFDLELAWHRLRLEAWREIRRDRGHGVTIGVDGMGVDHRGANGRRGRGMAGITPTWQGSDHRVLPGHPSVILCALTDQNFRAPLLFRKWDRQHPDWKSDSWETREAIREVAGAPGPDAVWAMDRGYSAKQLGPFLDSLQLRWAIRLSISKERARKKAAGATSGPSLLLFETLDGLRTHARDLARRAQLVAEFEEQRARDARRRLGPRPTQVSALPVRIVGRERVRTLIYSTSLDHKQKWTEPIALLVDRLVAEPEDILWYRRRWLGRWSSCETSARALKARDSWGLAHEDGRALIWGAIERELFLGAAAQMFLGKLAKDGSESAAATLLLPYAWSPVAPETPDDLRYRLARGLQGYFQARLREKGQKAQRSGRTLPRRTSDWFLGPVEHPRA